MNAATLCEPAYRNEKDNKSMLFNSYLFIFLFLPLALLGWYGLNRMKCYGTAQFFLVCMSLWFYAYFNPSYLAVILVSCAANYLLSALLKKAEKCAVGRSLTRRCVLRGAC